MNAERLDAGDFLDGESKVIHFSILIPKSSLSYNVFYIS